MLIRGRVDACKTKFSESEILHVFYLFLDNFVLRICRQVSEMVLGHEVDGNWAMLITTTMTSKVDLSTIMQATGDDEVRAEPKIDLSTIMQVTGSDWGEISPRSELSRSLAGRRFVSVPELGGQQMDLRNAHLPTGGDTYLCRTETGAAIWTARDE